MANYICPLIVSTTKYKLQRDNYCAHRYVDAEPSWAKQLEGEMTRGRRVITFRARSLMAAVSTTCQMIIHVKGHFFSIDSPMTEKSNAKIKFHLFFSDFAYLR